VAEKGALWLEISTYGRTAHGSMPDLGRNAIMMMNAVLNELQALEIPYENHHLLGGFSRSFNTIQGGVKTNVVPDFCTLTIDMRTVPGQDNVAITRQVQGLLDHLTATYPDFKATLKVLNDRVPVTTAEDDPMVAKFNQAIQAVRGQPSKPSGVRYYTDAAAYVPVFEVPMIICGPGQAGLAHQPNEFVEVDRLVEGVKIYLLGTTRLLG
jgi:succinyl-diaminopimelate desuccinylase